MSSVAASRAVLDDESTLADSGPPEHVVDTIVPEGEPLARASRPANDVRPPSSPPVAPSVIAERAPSAEASAPKNALVCRACKGSYPSDFVLCPRDGTSLSESRPNIDPMLGALVGGVYRVTRALGSGAMGRLYEAEHARLSRRFAIKVLHELYATKPDALVRFEREARACALVRSDHVLDVVDVSTTPDGRPCLVTELLDGEDLQARLDRIGKMPLGDAIAILRQACRGLTAAHAHGVVHRDLKPSNLFLSAGADGRIYLKILDFGVAKIRDDGELTRGGAVVGTPSYMAPEQARGSATADERADVYALGAVLYRMLVGRPPYLGADPTQTLTMLLEGPPPRPRAIERSIPEGIEAIIQRAMSREPDERYTTAADLERALAAVDITNACSADATVTAWQPSPAAGAGEPERPDTLILARGSVRTAEELTQKAKRARPVAAALFGAMCLCATTVAITLGEAVAVAAGRAALAESFALVVGTFTLAATVALAVRALRERWHSAAEIQSISARFVPAFAAAMSTLGALSLLAGALDPRTSAVPAPWLRTFVAMLVFVAVRLSRGGILRRFAS